MIVQCKACSTKFRFDESVMDGEGVWVRCSRCQNVFFQQKPSEPAPAVVIPEPPVENIPPVDLPAEDGGGGSTWGVMAGTAPTAPEENGAPAVETPVAPEVPEGKPETEEKELEEVPPPKKSGVSVKRILVIVLAILAVALAALLINPDLADDILGGGQAKAPAQAASIRIDLTDLKQRFVINKLLGMIRVVEGMAVNASGYPVDGIAVRAELYDAVGVMVREGASFGGNLLTEQELVDMNEEQLMKELAIPQGTDMTNERIAPGGMIPFMIVFLREPPGVTKTMVVPLRAQKTPVK